MKELTLTQKSNMLSIKLSGEIDILNAEQFFAETEKLYKESALDIEFDAADLKFIDSMALGTFVKINNLLKKDGKTLTVKNLREQIKKLFVICSLDSVIRIEA